MFKKIIIYLSMILLVTVVSRNTGMAMDVTHDEAGGLIYKESRSYVHFYASMPWQLSPAVDKSNQDSQSKEYEELEKKLKYLLEKLKRLGKEAKEKIRKEILPIIKREMEKLREWLREFHLEDDEQEPLKT